MNMNWLLTLAGGAALGAGSALFGVENGLGSEHHAIPIVLVVIGLILSIAPSVIRARRS